MLSDCAEQTNRHVVLGNRRVKLQLDFRQKLHPPLFPHKGIDPLKTFPNLAGTPYSPGQYPAKINTGRNTFKTDIHAIGGLELPVFNGSPCSVGELNCCYWVFGIGGDGEDIGYRVRSEREWFRRYCRDG